MAKIMCRQVAKIMCRLTDRVEILTTSNNDAGEPVAVIYKEPKKVTPKVNKKPTKGKKK